MRLDGDLMSQKMVRDCEGDALEGAENTSKSIQNICTHLHCLQCKHLENFSLTGTSAISAMFDFRLFWLYFIDSSLSLPWGFFIVFCLLWIFFFLKFSICSELRNSLETGISPPYQGGRF